MTMKPGRPPVPPETAQKRRQINLSDALADKARQIGDGNVSKGIRRALQEHKTMKLSQAIEEATALAYEQDADQYVINDQYFGWRIVHNEDPEAYAPGIKHRFLVHADGVDAGHIHREEITENWVLP